MTEKRVVVRAGNLWDGVAEKARGPREILVRGERIEAIETTVQEPAGAEVIDLPDRTITPGFIDCHVHLTFRPEMMSRFWSYSPASKALLGAEALGILLRNGFTTVRDCGDMDLHGFTVQDIRDALERGAIPGSRLITSGHIISSRAGHMNAMLSLAADNNPWEICLADGPDEIRRIVRNEIKHGIDWVKYASSGGFSTRGDDPRHVTYSREEMDALVGTAGEFGIPVSAHVYGDEAIRRSVQAGVRSIEHGSMASEETLRFMEKQGTFLVPTQLMAVRTSRISRDPAYWKENPAPEHFRAKVDFYRDTILSGAQKVAASRVKLAFGTDIGLFPYQVNNAREFGEMVKNGISPVRALRAATGTAAALLLRNDIGILSPGRYADIIAMPGDPFQDISVTEQVDFVMKGGSVVKSPDKAR